MKLEKNIHSSSQLPVYVNTAVLTSAPSDRYSHKETELILVKQGQIKCFVENETVTVSEGCVIIINSLCYHRISSEIDGTVITYVQFDSAKYLNFIYPQENDLLNVFMRTTAPKSYEVFTPDSFPSFFVCRCEELTASPKQFYEVEIMGYIFVLISAMCESGMISLRSKELNKQNINAILPIVNYIEEHLADPLSLDDISAFLFLDKSNVCKKFKRITGRTIHEYIDFRRMELAKTLILFSDLDIDTIALKCGFRSSNYFNKKFKTMENVSPSQYRNMRTDLS